MGLRFRLGSGAEIALLAPSPQPLRILEEYASRIDCPLPSNVLWLSCLAVVRLKAAEAPESEMVASMAKPHHKLKKANHGRRPANAKARKAKRKKIKT